MNLRELKEKVESTIADLKNHGVFPKENNLFDFKLKLNFQSLTDNLEIFLVNFTKDIISFSNGDGGIILIGINEDKATGKLDDVGLDEANFNLLNQIDLNLISQKFEKITKVGVSIDLQSFQISTRRYYYLLIEKQINILIPINDFPDYKLKKGDVVYRASSKNELANNSTQDFNRFLQVKANEKSKEFMEIWSKLLPEMFNINPREVLIINPVINKVYGFNGKDNVLSSSEIEIDKADGNGVFNIILNAISAGEIGKITNNEGKPLYKIVGEIKSIAPRSSISMTTLHDEVQKISNYKLSSVQLKSVIFHLKWVTIEQFKVDNSPENTVSNEFHEFIWLDVFDKIKGNKKIVFSTNAIEKIVQVINDVDTQKIIFKKELEPKNKISRI